MDKALIDELIKAVPDGLHEASLDENDRTIVDLYNVLAHTLNSLEAAEKKTRCLLREIDEQIVDINPSLALDVLGMAFYYDTRIWPPFKSAPPYQKELPPKEAMAAFREWRRWNK